MRFVKLISSLTLALLVLTSGCGKKQDEQTTPPETREVFHVFSYDGPMDSRYMVHFDENQPQAILYTHDETLILQHQPAASGAKYQGERIMVWIKGDEVLMEVDGKRVGPCAVSGLQPILAKAWLSGGTFWATGNEPSWNLVMTDEQIILMTDMGQNKFKFPGLKKGTFDPRNPYGKYNFTNDEKQKLEVEIISGRCTDTMSGEPFALSVRLVLDGQEMLGCGTGLF